VCQVDFSASLAFDFSASLAFDFWLRAPFGFSQPDPFPSQRPVSPRFPFFCCQANLFFSCLPRQSASFFDLLAGLIHLHFHSGSAVQ
jgi:hypothetical protein